MKVQTMWWCPSCRRRVYPRGSGPGRIGVHWTGGYATGRVQHLISGAPMIEGQLVPQREEAMA